MVTLVLDEDKRITSAYLTDDADAASTVIPEGSTQIEVADLPDLGLMNFRYVDGEFLYDPLISSESQKDDMERVVDHEFRLICLETGIDGI